MNQSAAIATTMFKTLEEAFKDGRKYVAGDQITAADFQLVGMAMSLWGNPHSNASPVLCQKVTVEYEKCPNLKRIIDTVKGENGV